MYQWEQDSAGEGPRLFLEGLDYCSDPGYVGWRREAFLALNGSSRPQQVEVRMVSFVGLTASAREVLEILFCDGCDFWAAAVDENWGDNVLVLLTDYLHYRGWSDRAVRVVFRELETFLKEFYGF